MIDGRVPEPGHQRPAGQLSKTEMAVINFIARGLALNPNARFLHITSGDDLALLNSQTARDIVQSDEYQALWPLQIADDAKAKKRWNVIVDGKKAGGVYAVSLGGQITGFRAGHMAPGFQGAIILDDLLKADEAYSPAAIKAANRRLLSTVKSRKANPATPVILIMQRVGENDPTGFIKGGNFPGKWEYVTIPALIDDDYVATLPEKLRPLVDRRPQGRQGPVLLLALQGAAGRHAGPGGRQGRGRRRQHRQPVRLLQPVPAGTAGHRRQHHQGAVVPPREPAQDHSTARFTPTPPRRPPSATTTPCSSAGATARTRRSTCSTSCEASGKRPN